ncbi:helix-turn-helix domain-containing protein [Pseudomonas chlororaphis]|uniref:helix-turn-helix domain-containing protein n=1 Tax=Pseudomonas chlororaphis TaxID=587753 RepID=UPI0015DEF1F4|nr:helix-turn-helix transcriptional regulator [Pseudomonas chlororaphis]QLL10697.1 helix-turn-helix transcriptional regulator [Pseudomonas chlororaphis subsp. aurantiaca]
MERKVAFGLALKKIRLNKGLAQEALAPSQAYVSEVEAGKKSPSIEKVEDLAVALGIHPVTLFARSFLMNGEDLAPLVQRIESELKALDSH